jgi:hypothetical protein
VHTRYLVSIWRASMPVKLRVWARPVAATTGTRRDPRGFWGLWGFWGCARYCTGCATVHEGNEAARQRGRKGTYYAVLRVWFWTCDANSTCPDVDHTPFAYLASGMETPQGEPVTNHSKRALSVPRIRPSDLQTFRPSDYQTIRPHSPRGLGLRVRMYLW